MALTELIPLGIILACAIAFLVLWVQERGKCETQRALYRKLDEFSTFRVVDRDRMNEDMKRDYEERIAGLKEAWKTSRAELKADHKVEIQERREDIDKLVDMFKPRTPAVIEHGPGSPEHQATQTATQIHDDLVGSVAEGLEMEASASGLAIDKVAIREQARTIVGDMV